MSSLIDWDSWSGTIVALLFAVFSAFAVIVVTRLVVHLVGRKVPWVRELARRLRNPWGVAVTILAIWIAAAISGLADLGWWPALSRVFLIASILAGAWLLAALVSFGFERLMAHEKRALGGPESRRRHTQLLVIHRLALVVIAVIALGTVLFTFPEMRALGTSLLASAGIVSVIAGLAAQSVLGNLIAGIQIAFTDAIRVGDVVVIEGEWGHIGEINLSYVVVYIWDERRLVVPCSHFTSNSIETWTRNSDKILGTVYMDLDWRVPMDALRAKFTQIVEASPAFDGRSATAFVTGSEGGFITVRFVMSADNSDDQWILRCEVREKLMTWLQQTHPEALPHGRVLLDNPAGQ
jgi:small-conductance mechanosensitive channel